MTQPSPRVRKLAMQLLAVEAASRSTAGPAEPMVRVCDRLRGSLTRFAGQDGFAALLRRALVIARADVRSLEGVTVSSSGELEGLEALAAGGNKIVVTAGLAITTHLLGLLITFIGKPLTFRLVRDAWPDIDLDE